ncbi:MAG TPA: redoxin domain-containing protein, partial [Candidatus Saccharimonadia bacterium]|nr:redoxin domain-containing protein [Candidatus Saccharimonadia bacterium]
MARFQAGGAAVMALSIDAPEVAARTASKGGLHFPLLSDPSAQVIRQYRMFNPPMSMAHMGYVLIDAHGRVQARVVDGYFGAHSAAILQRLAH